MITFQLLTLATLVYSVPISATWYKPTTHEGTGVFTSTNSRLNNMVGSDDDNAWLGFEYVNNIGDKYLITYQHFDVPNSETEYVDTYCAFQTYINPNYVSGAQIFPDYNYGSYSSGGFYLNQSDYPYGNVNGSYFQVSYNPNFDDLFSNVEFVYELRVRDTEQPSSTWGLNYQFVTRMYEHHNYGTDLLPSYIYKVGLFAFNDFISQRSGYYDLEFDFLFYARIVPLEEVQAFWRAEGYEMGYDSGYAVGYDYGFSLGNDSNNVWKNLLGAIIDTPILYLRKFFGYEVFGVNIYALLATLISLIVALSIFRLVRSIV